MGLMPTLLIQKCFFKKALHLVSELGPKAAGCNADFAGNLGVCIFKNTIARALSYLEATALM